MTNRQRAAAAVMLMKVINDLENARQRGEAKAQETIKACDLTNPDVVKTVRDTFVAGWIESENKQAAAQIQVVIDLYLTPKTAGRAVPRRVRR